MYKQEKSANNYGMAAIIINNNNFKKEIKYCKTPVLLSFGFNSGLPSILLKRTADALSDEFKGKIKVGFVDSINADAVKEFNIRFFPVSVVIKDGIVTDKIVGSMCKSDMLKILQ